jgi:hypothetical protein
MKRTMFGQMCRFWDVEHELYICPHCVADDVFGTAAVRDGG